MLATWIDLLIIYGVLMFIKLSIYIFKINVYLPEEFTFLLLFLLYSSFTISVKGYTVGKWLMNLIVVNKRDYGRLSIIRSIFRESLLKLFSGLFFFIGFLWIAFSKQKNSLHDWFAGSKVIRITSNQKKVNIWGTIGICSFALLLGSYLYKVSNLVYTGKKMELPKTSLNLPFVDRRQDEINDISKISSDTLFVNWLNNNSQTPEEYAIQIASSHKLTLFGETHGVKDNLDLLNRIIPDLYYKAGIRCIGMECIPAKMNRKIKKLINGKTYDKELAMLIARSQPWKLWGMREYWDVLETVWKLNKNIPDSCPKMRIVGIDEDWNGPKIALVLPSSSDDGLKNVPIWERLKLFTSIDDIVKLAYRDELMARNVEKEIIEKGEKGIVWIGSAHTPLHYGYPIINNNKILFVKGRFGLILNQKYNNDVGQILLLQSFSEIETRKQALNTFLELIMSVRDTMPVGFNIEKSPFGKLRDSTARYFNKHKTICLEDICQGLIFLKPLDKLKPCTWDKEYISRTMFLKYKLFYELKSNQKLSNNKECNEHFFQASKEAGFTD